MVATESKPRPAGAVEEPFTGQASPQFAAAGVGFEYPTPPTTPPPVQPGPAEPAPVSHPAAPIFVPLVLIGLGIFFLIGNVVPIGGSMLFIGLGLAFLAARVIWNNYGLAVPAGILLGFGTFVALSEADWLPTSPESAEGG